MKEVWNSILLAKLNKRFSSNYEAFWKNQWEINCTLINAIGQRLRKRYFHSLREHLLQHRFSPISNLQIKSWPQHTLGSVLLEPHSNKIGSHLPICHIAVWYRVLIGYQRLVALCLIWSHFVNSMYIFMEGNSYSNPTMNPYTAVNRRYVRQVLSIFGYMIYKKIPLTLSTSLGRSIFFLTIFVEDGMKVSLSNYTLWTCTMKLFREDDQSLSKWTVVIESDGKFVEVWSEHLVKVWLRAFKLDSAKQPSLMEWGTWV